MFCFFRYFLSLPARFFLSLLFSLSLSLLLSLSLPLSLSLSLLFFHFVWNSGVPDCLSMVHGECWNSPAGCALSTLTATLLSAGVALRTLEKVKRDVEKQQLVPGLYSFSSPPVLNAANWEAKNMN